MIAASALVVRVPNADRAIIEPPKLRDYLLSPIHPAGRFKAEFFRQLGYLGANWSRLDRDLRFQHLSAAVSRVSVTSPGTTYEIRAMLRGPSGFRSGVVSVWMIRSGQEHPRLVTVYPGGPS